MRVIRKIHKTLFDHTKKTYKFNISQFDVKMSDNTDDIIKKIDILAHVVANPHEWYVLKPKK